MYSNALTADAKRRDGSRAVFCGPVGDVSVLYLNLNFLIIMQMCAARTVGAR